MSETPPLPAGATAAADAAPARLAEEFGPALRRAREAAGMSAATLASRLRLNAKQILALERGDLAALPALVYVRGFVRGCARELHIDPAPLLADLDRAAGAQPGAEPEPSGKLFSLARVGDSSRPLIALALGLLLVAGLVGTLMPRRQPAALKPAAVERVPAAPEAAKPADAPADAPVTAPATAPVTAPANAPAAVPASAPAIAPAKSTVVAPAPEAKPTGATPVLPTVTPAAAPAPALRPAAAAPGATPPRVATAAGASKAAAASAPAGAPGQPPVLVLRFHTSAWVEVVQSDGVTLLSQVCPPGSVQTIKASTPLRLVVGNAASVEAQFRGAPVDLARNASPNGVARLTLE